MDDREGRILGRYLIGREPSEELLRRYGAACVELLPEAAQDPLPRFVARRPWSLPFLDAAESLSNRDGPLRRRLLLMLALLETTPEHADRLLPRSASPPGLLLRSAGRALASGVKIALGVLVVRPWARAAGRS